MLEREVQLQEMLPLMEEYLHANKTVMLQPKGVSMRPMLRQGIDSVIISSLPEKLCKYDLPLYRYPNGKFVLHRIVKVQEDCYLCLGDNTYNYEIVKPEYLIGLVTAFKRGDKEIPVTDFRYRLYCHVWVSLYPVRKFVRRAIGWLKRHILK